MGQEGSFLGTALTVCRSNRAEAGRCMSGLGDWSRSDVKGVWGSQVPAQKGSRHTRADRATADPLILQCIGLHEQTHALSEGWRWQPPCVRGLKGAGCGGCCRTCSGCRRTSIHRFMSATLPSCWCRLCQSADDPQQCWAAESAFLCVMSDNGLASDSSDGERESLRTNAHSAP